MSKYINFFNKKLKQNVIKKNTIWKILAQYCLKLDKGLQTSVSKKKTLGDNTLGVDTSIKITAPDKGSSPKITTSHNELTEADIKETFDSLEPVEIDLNLGEITEEGEETRKKQDILLLIKLLLQF